MDDEEENEEGKEQGNDGPDEGLSGTDRIIREFNQNFGWLDTAVKVREVTGQTIEQVFDMNIVEYFNYLSYIKSRNMVDDAINREALNKGKVKYY